MTKGNETNAAIEWIVATLKANQTIATEVENRIFEVPVPSKLDDDETYILISFLPGGKPHSFIGGRRLWVSSEWIIRAVRATTSFAAIEAVAKAIDQALDMKSGTASRGTIISCQRIEEYRTTVTDKGRQVKHLGGIFLIKSQ